MLASSSKLIKSQISLTLHSSLSSIHGGARGVVVIVVGNGDGDKSSDPGRD